MGDYYFDKSIPFENLKQNVMKTYGLPENETTSSASECVWVSGHVTVRLFTTPKYTQLQVAYREQEEEEAERQRIAQEKKANSFWNKAFKKIKRFGETIIEEE